MDLETKRNGNGMEMEIIIRLVWNWGGMEWIARWNFRYRGMDKEWKEIQVLDGIVVEWNGIGMEWNGNGIKMVYANVTAFQTT